MKSKRALSCRSKPRRLPTRFASRRRSLSTPDLHSKAVTTPIHGQHIELNTIEEYVDTPNDSNEGYSKEQWKCQKISADAAEETSSGEFIAQSACREQTFSTEIDIPENVIVEAKSCENVDNINLEMYI